MTNLLDIKELVSTCLQCGTCTASCPNSFAMDITPRKLWRLVLMDRTEDVFNSTTFALCSTCYYCTLRCPRGLELTTAMSMLKAAAAKENIPKYRVSAHFYSSFMESVRRHGRVRETEFLTLYFMAMKNPLLPMKITPLGIRLLKKNKVKFEMPSKPGTGNLTRLFEKVSQMEEDK
ncbi:MAG: 4Fe-4S dicluster domain-containing protein [Desulfobacteraceae bacterium]